MPKIIGGFVNPKTGEKDDIDLETVSLIELLPRCNESNEIEYSLSYDIEEDNLFLRAKLNNNLNAVIKIDSVQFAKSISESVYGNFSIDSTSFIIDVKNQCTTKLNELFSLELPHYCQSEIRRWPYETICI